MIDEPFFWRVAEGVLYAEMPEKSTIRPPILSEWEGERAKEFRSAGRRRTWLAARALAKALVREYTGVTGVVDIRENAAGQVLVYRNGLPVADLWLGITTCRGRVAAVVADRPVALQMREVAPSQLEVAAHVASRSELRTVRRAVSEPVAACTALRAIKEAGLAARRGDTCTALRDVTLDANLGVHVDDVQLHPLALRVVRGIVVAIVGRTLLHEPAVTRVVMEKSAIEAAARAEEAAAAAAAMVPAEEPGQAPQPSRLQAAMERSVARARRVADARARWHRLRWQS